MHEMSADDARDAGGGVMYPSDAEPATVDSSLDYGVLWHELLNLVKGAEVTLSGPIANPEDAVTQTDALQAVKKIAGRKPDFVGMANLGQDGLGLGAEIVRTVNADPFDLEDLFACTFLSESGGPFSGGIVHLEEDAKYDGKLIVVINDTGTPKVVGSDSTVGSVNVTIPNGYGWAFHNVAGIWRPMKLSLTTAEVAEVTNLYWTQGRFDSAFAAAFPGALAAEFGAAFDAALATKDTDDLAESATKHYVTKDAGSFTMHLYDSANSDLDSDTATWEVIDGHVFLTLPQLDGTVAAGDVRLTAAADAALPAEIQAAVTRFFPVVVIEGGTRQLTTAEFFDTDDKVHVNMTGGGAVRIDPQTIVYKL